MSSFYGSSGGGAAAAIKSYDDLLDKPIGKIKGTKDSPALLYNYTPGVYTLTGYYQAIENGSVFKSDSPVFCIIGESGYSIVTAATTMTIDSKGNVSNYVTSTYLEEQGYLKSEDLVKHAIQAEDINKLF